MGSVKTTMDLPDDLFRSIKLKAAREDRSIKDVTTELLRRGLATQAEAGSVRRASFPLVVCPPGPAGGLTPEEVADVLIAADAEAAQE